MSGIVALVVWTLSLANSAGSEGVVFREPGVYKDSSGTCAVRISVSTIGGFLQLHIPAAQPRPSIKDVTGVAFVGGGKLVYSVSPAYGRPGVFLFDCRTRQTVTLVRPRSFSNDYPDGADYFELSQVKDEEIYFYYASDVDTADFEKLRTNTHLYKVSLNGSVMRRAH